MLSDLSENNAVVPPRRCDRMQKRMLHQVPHPSLDGMCARIIFCRAGLIGEMQEMVGALFGSLRKCVSWQLSLFFCGGGGGSIKSKHSIRAWRQNVLMCFGEFKDERKPLSLGSNEDAPYRHHVQGWA